MQINSFNYAKVGIIIQYELPLRKKVLNTTDIIPFYQKQPAFKEAKAWMDRSENGSIHLRGLIGSAAAVVCAGLCKEVTQCSIIILNDLEQAGYFYHDLTQLLGEQRVCFFPSSYRKTVSIGQEDAANCMLRTEALSRIHNKEEGLILVSYPEALCEQVVTIEQLHQNMLTLHVDERVDTLFIAEVLYKYGFERVEYVYEPGQYATRGSIIDVYSYANDLPYRIDFFGDTIDSIRSFDIESQLSIQPQQEILIVPSLSHCQGEKISFFDFVSAQSKLFVHDLNWINERMSMVTASLLDHQGTMELPSLLQTIEIGANKQYKQTPSIEFETEIQPSFHKNFRLVADHLHRYLEEGYELFLLSNNPKQIERIREIFAEREDNIAFTEVANGIHEGYIDHQLKKLFYTEHQLFDRFHKYNLRTQKARTGKAALSLKELTNFTQGDYVVHIDHGVGRFGGLIRTEINGKMQEVIRLYYKNDDIIFVSVHALHKISKYKGKEGTPVQVSKLGTGAWEKIKSRTKSKLKDIARELIALYAQRITETGFAFSPDSYLQQELEASFFYEDTPDQLKATIEVKQDMESSKPMDRLICGDVGFGKTEIAIRAAFKAATDGKQVALLVPTTVLALQHYNSFRKRLKNFPVEIEYLSRARKGSDVKSILYKLEHEGKPEIIIGTHKLIGKGVKFKNLGLLIIDEEQKFGVSTKDKLKELRVNVDTLTLTATPIPRTLQFSLMGARDLSVIQTPPPNRHPIQTEVHTFNEALIKEAIEFEMGRNGQLFFVHNRVQNIEEIRDLLKRLIPDARICVGHGQMEPSHLEAVIVDFINQEYDILVATTIIESGIDISNVNTIIINNAQNFGLSDLHQLRGRVGRDNKKAFCYLLAPPLSTLSTESRRRLQAIENFSDLGSGIHIAMQDLDIRGAGNLLGAEQSGFIADLGYETYQKILSEAINELKSEEFAYLYSQDKQANASDAYYLAECNFESDLELLFPSSYIPSDTERMILYRELDSLHTTAQITQYKNRLKDRFGSIPTVGLELIEVVTLRQQGKMLGVEKLLLKNGQLYLYFPNQVNTAYFQSKEFGAIVQYVQQNPRVCQFREKADKQSISIQSIQSVSQASHILEEIMQIQANL